MKASKNLLIGIVLGTLIVLVGGFLAFKQNELSKAETQNQKIRFEQHTELMEAERISGLVCLMSNVLNKVDDELKNNPGRILSDETISRIASLSDSFVPDSYNYVESDSLADNALSPERGQLLLTLVQMHIDFVSFAKIKLMASFARADLRGADLRGADLSEADLMSANFEDADLNKASLERADLRGAMMWGANLSEADFTGAAMNRVDLRWADLHEADLKEAILDGAVLTGAKLRNADLTGAMIRYADLSGAFFNDAILTGVVMFGTDLSRANLSGADLSEADLRGGNLSEANLNEANLSEAKFRGTGVQEGDWLTKLSAWRVKGAKEIQEQCKIAEDASGRANYSVTKVED